MFRRTIIRMIIRQKICKTLVFVSFWLIVYNLAVHQRALSKYSGSYPIIPFLDRPHNLKALDEIFSIALETGGRLQISHLIFACKKSWPTAQKAVHLIEKAQNKGLEVIAGRNQTGLFCRYCYFRPGHHR